ncbi:hypothetical protein [Neisseria dentiae]|uniref:hypothetical protein n=1 Tax=Neisseria dentiae TaxID=194197 RepID=UPI00359FB27A
MKPIFSAALWAAILSLTACAHSDGLNKPATKPSEERIRIYKSDGSRQCEGGGTSLEAMKSQLQGIRVYTAEKQVLHGMMFPAVCGGQTGSINVYTIAEQDLPEAEKRGFNILKQKD